MLSTIYSSHYSFLWFSKHEPKLLKSRCEKRHLFLFFLHFPSCNGNSNNRKDLPNILSTTKPWLISCADMLSMTGFRSTNMKNYFSSLLFKKTSFSATFLIWNDIATFSFEKHGALLLEGQKTISMIHSHAHPRPSKVGIYIFFLDTILSLKIHTLSCFKYFNLRGDTQGSIKP